MGATARSRTGGGDESDEAPRERAAIDYGPLDRRLGYLLRRAQIAVFRDFFAAFADIDIRPGQYSILTVIEANPGLRQGAVGEALGIKRANFVAMVDELETRGLLRRDPSPGDRRSYALNLTAKGARLVAELHIRAERHEQKIIDAVGADTYRALAAPLRAIAAIGEAEDAPEGS